jgi:hypothetical protein
VTSVAGKSPDFAQVLYVSNLDPSLPAGDLFLASATAASAPLPLSMTTDAGLGGDAFTADSSRVLYYTGLDALGVGRLQSQPVGGGAAFVLAERSRQVHALGGTRVLFNDHFLVVPKRPGRADLFVADSASGLAGTLIATRADVPFWWTSANDRVVYAFNEGTDLDGIYVAPIP